MKNANAISWNEYFMEIAKLSAKRSKDPVKQVGCCIIDPETKHILSVGFNGLPNGFSDDLFAWEKSDNFYEDKNSYVAHAESNAILNATSSLKGATAYVTLFPCNECAKLLVQAGIKKVIYLDEYSSHPEKVAVSKRIFDVCGIRYEKYNIERSP